MICLIFQTDCFTPNRRIKTKSHLDRVKLRITHLVERLIEFLADQVPLRRRNVAEANVGALRLNEQAPAVARLDEVDEVARKREHAVDVCLKTAHALRLPHVPELDDVGTAAALNVTVTAVE